MSVTISIPAALRTFTDGSREAAVSGNTAGEALNALTAAYPELRRHLYDDSGRLRGFVNIFAGEENIKETGGLDTALADGTQISIVPAVAGGAERC